VDDRYGRVRAAGSEGVIFDPGFWTWKVAAASVEPPVGNEVRALIRSISAANPLWGAPRIHGELIKLGVDVSQATVATYMARCTTPPTQT
jgi:hypothetical protein